MRTRTLLGAACSVVAGCLAGCASMFLGGGSIVSDDYKMPKVVVAYRAEGTVPARVEYFLVESEEGLAMFERSEDGSGTLHQTRWTDEQGDHFAAWVKGGSAHGHGYEFIVPLEKSKNAKRFVYPAGTYTVKTIDGIRRPVPRNPDTQPVAVLIPK